MLFDYLPIKTREVRDDQEFYGFILEFPHPMGRCCLPFSKIHLPKIEPLVFQIPLDGSVMSVDDWISDKKDFCGVDRSIDPIRLSGLTYQSTSMYESITDVPAFMWREGAAPDLMFKEGKIHYWLQMDTWAWIVKGNKKVALICTFPGWNAKAVLK